MRPESPEERSGQKVAGPPSYRIENEYNPEAMPQYFQIHVAVLEGRNFSWFNPRSANSFVVVMLGKKKYKTSIRKNKQEPHYRESFSFEIYATLHDLQISTLTLTVMEPRCYAPPRLLGEAAINLGMVWGQPYHRVFQKWAQLLLPPSARTVGFLKVDISISYKGNSQRMVSCTTDAPSIMNFLMPCAMEQQHANFVITLHGAFGLPNTSRNPNDRHHSAKPPNTFVRVLFCGLQAKTAVQNRTNNPMYNEQVSMVEMFPNSNHVFRMEVCSADTFVNRIVASAFLNLDDISYDGHNGFLPTFGPSLLPLYGPSTGPDTATKDCPYYRGLLLLSLTAIVPCYQQTVRTISVEPVSPISVENLWMPRGFCIFCPIFEVSMLDSRVASHFCGVAITIGELPTGSMSEEDFTFMMTVIKTRKLHYTGSLEVVRSKSEYGCLEFFNTFPILQSVTWLPDFQYRIYRNNAIARIACNLKVAASEVECNLQNYDYVSPKNLLHDLYKALYDASNEIIMFLEIFSLNNSCDVASQHKTELDKKQLMLQIEEMKRAHETISKIISHSSASHSYTALGNATRKCVKKLLSEVQLLLRSLMKLVFKATEGWPDVVIWLLHEGSRVGFCKISSSDIIYSDVPGLRGKDCGRIQTIYFKPLKCSRHVNSLSTGCMCVVGKVELLAWMGLHGHRSAFEHALPKGCELKIKDFDMCVKCGGIMLECRVYIHKARLYCSMGDDIGDMFLRINTLSCSRESKSIEKSSTPAWNQLLRLRKMMFTSSDRLVKYPPVVFVEVIVTDSMGKTELIGSFEINAVVGDGCDIKMTPKLQRYEIYHGTQSIGKVFMAVQILQEPNSRAIEMMSNATYLEKKWRMSIETQFCYSRDVTSEIISTASVRHATCGPERSTLESLLKFDMSCMSRKIGYDGPWYKIPEKILKNTMYNPVLESYTTLDYKEFDNPLTEFESLPPYLIPHTSTYKVDVYWWGLREIDIAKKPSVVLEIEDLKIKSDAIVNKRSNCNFPNARLTEVFEASFNELCCPAMKLKLYDNCTFGRTLYVGMKVVRKPSKFFTSWYPILERDASLERASITSRDFIRVSQTLYVKKRNLHNDDAECLNTSELSCSLSNLRKKRSGWRRLFCKKELDEEEYTLLPIYSRNNTEYVPKKLQKLQQTSWWSRYVYCQKNNHSNQENNIAGDTFIIYDSELERQPQFSKFKDWCATLKLYSSKKTGIPEKDEELRCGLLKAGIVIYKWPPPENTIAVTCNGVELNKGFFHNYPSNNPANYLVRIYVIKAISLTAKNFNGQSHPYVVVSCGGKYLGDRNSHIKNNFNPIFGTVYELRCTLPEDYQLVVSLYNYDVLEPDELIGSTTIDLEDRIYSKHRAKVGLAAEYNMSEPGRWRDCLKPSAILEELCASNHLPPPSFPDISTVVINGVEYKDNDEVKPYASALESRENVCLSLLHNWESLPVCGYPLVPEHVETRSLYNPELSEAVQGKLHLWIDIFPLDSEGFIPPAVDITPTRNVVYELRVTILEIKLFNKDKKYAKFPNVYVRAWTGFIHQMQRTSCRSDSSDGNYHFNWCMVFKLNYDHVERKVINSERNQFMDTGQSAPPILHIQIMDDENTCLDKPLGCLALNLNELQPPGLSDSQNSTSTNENSIKKIDLFSANSMLAWWPLQTNNSDESNTLGAIKIKLILLSHENALLMPVGLQNNLNPPASSQKFQSHSQTFTQTKYSSFKAFFYKHNALWGSLTGITIILFVIFTTIYFFYVYV